MNNLYLNFNSSAYMYVFKYIVNLYLTLPQINNIS